MVAYAAVVLALVGLLVLAALVSQEAGHVNRFGLLLQVAGVLVVVLNLLRIKRFQPGSVLNQPVDYHKGANPPETASTASASNVAEIPARLFFAYYLKRNRTVVWGNIFTSLILILVLGGSVITASVELAAWELIALLGLAGLAFAWSNLFMLVHIHLMARSQVPGGLLRWFFSIDLPVSFFGLPLAGLMHILLNWLPWLYGFIFQKDPKRVLILVTMPCFLFGLVLQLIATFIPGNPPAAPFEISFFARLWAIIWRSIG